MWKSLVCLYFINLAVFFGFHYLMDFLFNAQYLLFVVLLPIFIIWFGFSYPVGKIAEKSFHRNRYAWVLISLCITPLFAFILLLSLGGSMSTDKSNEYY